MGSFNVQCAISKETILTGDKVVSFFLEEEKSENGNSVYKLGSLPVHGVYGDYGHVYRIEQSKEPLGQADAISVAKKLYKYDYTEKGLESYHGSPGRGGAKGMFEATSAHWVIKQEAYDQIWGEVDESDIFDALMKGEVEKAFNHKIERGLLQELKSMDGFEPISLLPAAQLVKGIQQLNISFEIQSSMTSQFGLSDYKGRKPLHVALKKMKSGQDKSSSVAARYSCFVTGHAVSPNETVYVLPVRSAIHLSGGKTLGHLNTHSVTGMHQFCERPIKCLVSENGSIVFDDQERSLNLTMLGTGLSFQDLQKENFIEELLSGKFTSELYQESYQTSGVVLSSEACKILMKGKERELVMKDFELFCDAAEAFSSACFALSKGEPELSKQILTSKGVYKDTKDLFSLMERVLSRAKDVNSFYMDIGYMFRETCYELKTSRADYDYMTNQFFKMINTSDSDGMFHHNVKSALSKVMFYNREEDFGETVKKFNNVASVFADCFQLACNLDRFGIGLRPSQAFQTEISIGEQRSLNEKVRESVTSSVLKTLQKEGEHYGL